MLRGLLCSFTIGRFAINNRIDVAAAVAGISGGALILIIIIIGDGCV